jgi:thioester reductase-like protein
LGAHILAALAESRNVRKIFAFMRPGGNAEQTASDRLDSSLRSKGFDIPLKKVIPLYSDVAQENFGLDAALFNSMKSQVTHVIHCAWTVNFAINLAAFESQILGLYNLLTFSMQTDRSAHVLFCSSIGTAQATKCPARIASAPIPSFDNCSAMGYSQSKLVGERITEVAAKAGANATVLRIGQIIPGRRRDVKLWNPSEAVPLMIRSASSASIGALPLMDAARDSCDWIEADTLADSILQIAGIGQEIARQSLVYNLVNPHSFSWRHDFLPALKRVGLQFDILTWQEWIERLEASSDDARANPSKKLLDFWQKQTPREGELVFETDAAEADSSAFRAACRLTDGDLLGQVVTAWEEHAKSTQM